MNTKKKSSPESIVREIKRRTRRKYSAEEKIRIVLEGLRGEQSITDLSRREGIHPDQTLSSYDSRENRTLSQVNEKPYPSGSLLLSFRTRREDPGMGRLLQQPAIP